MFRQFKHFDAQSFRADISVQPWDELMGMENPNSMWLKWKSLFLEVCDKHAPFRTKRVRASRSPWINNDLKKMMYRRDRLTIIASRTKNPEDWTNFKKMRNQVNNGLKMQKRLIITIPL